MESFLIKCEVNMIGFGNSQSYLQTIIDLGKRYFQTTLY